MLRQLIAGLLMLMFAVQVAFAALDINTATADEFDQLKGVGPVKAKAIVDYRVKNGPFKSVEDIKNVPGIGESTFEAIKRDIRVGAGSGLRATKSMDSSRDSARRPEKGEAVGAPSMDKGAGKAGKSAGADAPKTDGKAKTAVVSDAKPDAKGRTAEAPKGAAGAAKSEAAK